MRTLTLVAALALAATLTAGQPEPKAKADPRQKADQDVLQGSWVVAGLESGGKAQPEKNYRGNTLTFAKDKATLKEGNYPPLEFTFAIDPTRTPKTIDLAGKNAVLRGIYKLDGDDLTVCLGIGPTRPIEFATKAGGDTELFTLKRNRWERFSEKGAGFTAEMPGKPGERKRETPLPGGPATTTVRLVRSEMEGVTYAVAVTPLPGRLDADPARAARAAALEAVAAEVAGGAKVVVESDREFKSEGKGAYVGRELSLALDAPGSKDRLAARARQFVAGERLYSLLVVGGEDAMKMANVARFWTSFRVVPDKK